MAGNDEHDDAFTFETFASKLAVLVAVHATQAQRHRADLWLQRFQRSADAWTIVCAVLNDENTGVYAPELRLFAAQTLRVKVRRKCEACDRRFARPHVPRPWKLTATRV